MELFIDLILTFSLSLILTSLFVKLVSMQQPNNTDKERVTEEAQKIDKFQHIPFKEEVIKLEECPSEGKSSVELCNVVGVNKEDCKFQDVVVDDNSKEGETEDEHDDGKGTGFEPETEHRGDRELCEIEIESEEEEVEEEIGIIMDDWEEIGRKDFEELLGNKAGLYNVDVHYEK